MDAKKAKRLAVKTLTYRLWAVAVTVTVAWAVTGDLRVALGLGAIENLVKIGTYAGFEGVWTVVMGKGVVA